MSRCTIVVVLSLLTLNLPLRAEAAEPAAAQPPAAQPVPAPAAAPQAPSGAQGAGEKAVAPAAEPAKTLGAELTPLWPNRDQPETVKRIDAIVEAAMKRAPGELETLIWAARWATWKSDTSLEDDEARRRFGKQGWDLAEKAIAIAPAAVAPRYWAAVACGFYSEGTGVMAAVSQGLEGKFRRNLDLAIAKDPDFDNGGPMISLGRYWWVLPWPKHDADKAIEILRASLKKHPGGHRARVYLAEALYGEGKAEAEEALSLIKQVLAVSAAPDPAELRLAQRMAKILKPKIEEELK